MIDDATTDAHLQAYIDDGQLDGNAPEVMAYKPDVMVEIAKNWHF